MKKQQTESASGVQDLCRKLKLQLDELSVPVVERKKAPSEDEVRRGKLMEELKKQLADLSK